MATYRAHRGGAEVTRAGECIAVLAGWWKHPDGTIEDAAVLEGDGAQHAVPVSALKEVTS